MSQPELRADPRFGSSAARVANVDALDAIIAAWTRELTTEQLVLACTARRVPCAPVRELDEVVNDPHMHERGALQRVQHPDLGEVVLPAGTMRFADAPRTSLTPSRAVGADTEAVLHDWLGLSPDAIRRLSEVGAI